MTEISNIENSSSVLTAADAVRGLMRFVGAVRYHKRWAALVTTVVFAGGIFYYMTVPRTYEATSQLLIDESQLRASGTAQDGNNQRAKLPTYERLITCDTVLKSALVSLKANSPEALQDLSGSEETHIATLRKLTTARAARNTNIIELSYRSKSSETAEIVLSAIMDAFLDFIKRLHQDNSVEALEVLNEERHALEEQIRLNQAKMVDLRTKVGAVGFDERLGDSHPDVQRAMKLNDNLTEVRKTRVELQAQLATIQAAIRDGKDLKEHLYSVDKEAAQSIVANALGVNPQLTQRYAMEEQKLMDDRARLQTIAQHLGPTHPQRVELELSIQNRQVYLADFQKQLNNRMGAVQNEQLGPIILSLVQEKLAKALSHEQALQREYGIAEGNVVAMNGSLSELMLVQRNLDRFNRSYDMLVEKIQGIDLGHNQADVRVSAVGEPKANSWPVHRSYKLSSFCVQFLVPSLRSASSTWLIPWMTGSAVQKNWNIKQPHQFWPSFAN